MSKRNKKRAGAPPKGVKLYYDMRVEDDFETAAQRIFSILRKAQAARPAAPRHLFLDVQGHRNDAGGFDRDAYELMTEYGLKLIGPYLTSIHIPLLTARSTFRQRNDIPDVLIIGPSDDEADHRFDVESLAIKPREHTPDARKSAPSVRAIADYLGLGDGEPGCLICWATPVERAHVVPRSRGGSYDVRNFALLCAAHHREAPDVADAAAFWRWVDRAAARCGYERMSRLDPDLLRRFYALSDGSPPEQSQERPADFADAVRVELVDVWGWTDAEIETRLTWKTYGEADVVLSRATTRHFGVPRKPSTYAWALHVAYARLNGQTNDESGPPP